MAGSMRHAVVRAAGTLGLKQPMSAAALSGVVEAAMAEFARMVAGVGLVAFLLPSPEQLQANLRSHRPVGTLPPASASALEGSVVSMMDELRGAVAGPLFAEAMAVRALCFVKRVWYVYHQASGRVAVEMVLQGVGVQGEPPLVKVLPLVACSADDLAVRHAEVDAAVGALPVVQHLALATFANDFSL